MTFALLWEKRWKKGTGSVLKRRTPLRQKTPLRRKSKMKPGRQRSFNSTLHPASEPMSKGKRQSWNSTLRPVSKDKRKRKERFEHQFESRYSVLWFKCQKCARCGKLREGGSHNSHVISRGAGGTAEHRLPHCWKCHNLYGSSNRVRHFPPMDVLLGQCLVFQDVWTRERQQWIARCDEMMARGMSWDEVSAELIEEHWRAA